MIDVISFTDEKDEKLGTYFQDSKNSLTDNIGSLDDVCVLKEVGSEICTMSNVNQIMSNVNDKCICAVYTHGNPFAFMANGMPYITKENTLHFKDSFVYSTACLTARDIGKQLIDDGCLAFVGFNNESQVLCDSDYANVIMNCDQACLFAFLNDNVNLKEALKLAIAYYETQIEICSRNNNIMLQSILIANREALCMYGDETLTRNDFNH